MLTLAYASVGHLPSHPPSWAGLGPPARREEEERAHASVGEGGILSRCHAPASLRLWFVARARRFRSGVNVRGARLFRLSVTIYCHPSFDDRWHAFYDLVAE